MAGRQPHHTRWYEMTPEKGFILFVILAASVFLMGGGSRHDIESVGPLRFATAILLAIGIYFQTAEGFRRVAQPVVLLLLLGLLMALQLVPLPPSWWQSLAGRDTIAAIDDALGMSSQWRPLTLSPMKTGNSLASLVVPLAALVLLALLNGRQMAKVRKVIIFAGLASALLGVAQVILRGSDGLYLYEITNSGSAVGLFSNRNHNALFLNIALLFTLFEKWRFSQEQLRVGNLLLLAVQAVLLMAILINGSRFGLILLAFVASVLAVRLWLASRAPRKRAGGRKAKKFIGLAAGAVAVVLIAMFALLSRSPALERLFSQGFDEDQRSATLPYVLDLLTTNLPFGVGFGAFEQAYRMVEPTELLGPRYLNHAHNDWLQLGVEGGLGGIVLLVAALLLLGRRSLQLWKARDEEGVDLKTPVIGLLTLVMIGMHSLVDYPLRTPSIMLVAACSLAMIFWARLPSSRSSTSGDVE